MIPPTGGYETARYGDRPFPVVPVDYSDRSHGEATTAGKLAGKINDPENPGSTFNLYQEMSFGQLFPNGTVPSAGLATATWDYAAGFEFTKNTADPDTCRGVTNAAAARRRRTSRSSPSASRTAGTSCPARATTTATTPTARP